MPDNKTFDKNADIKDKRYAELHRSGIKKRQKIVISAMLFVIGTVISVFIVGYIIAFVMPPRELIVRVNDVEYTLSLIHI